MDAIRETMANQIKSQSDRIAELEAENQELKSRLEFWMELAGEEAEQ